MSMKEKVVTKVVKNGCTIIISLKKVSVLDLFNHQ